MDFRKWLRDKMSAIKRKQSTPQKLTQQDSHSHSLNISNKIKQQCDSLTDYRKSILAKYPNLDEYESITVHNLNQASIRATHITNHILVLNLRLKKAKIQMHKLVKEDWAIIEANYGRSLTLRRKLSSDPLNKTTQDIQTRKKQKKELLLEMNSLEHEITKQMAELSKNQMKILKGLELLNYRTEMIPAHLPKN